MGETASRYEGYMRIYWISSGGQPTRGGPPAWGLGVGLKFLTVKIISLGNVTKVLGTWRILSINDLSERKWT
jgi:hypothetical protein